MRSLRAYAFVCGAVAVGGSLLPLMATEKQEREAAESSAPSRTATVLEGVRDVVSGNAVVRVAAAARLQAHRKKIVSNLIRIVQRIKPHSRAEVTAENIKEPTPEVLAMTLLGAYRSSEAVSALVERIDYRDPRTLITGRYYTTAESFPAAVALVKIGLPSVAPLITTLTVPGTPEKARELALWALQEILGRRLATVRLEDEIERMKDGDQAKRQRLQDALRLMLSRKPAEGAGKG